MNDPFRGAQLLTFVRVYSGDARVRPPASTTRRANKKERHRASGPACTPNKREGDRVDLGPATSPPVVGLKEHAGTGRHACAIPDKPIVLESMDFPAPGHRRWRSSPRPRAGRRESSASRLAAPRHGRTRPSRSTWTPEDQFIRLIHGMGGAAPRDHRRPALLARVQSRRQRRQGRRSRLPRNRPARRARGAGAPSFPADGVGRGPVRRRRLGSEIEPSEARPRAVVFENNAQWGPRHPAGELRCPAVEKGQSRKRAGRPGCLPGYPVGRRQRCR